METDVVEFESVYIRENMVYMVYILEVGFFENRRAEPNSSFSFRVPSRTQTARLEAREKLWKKFAKNSSYLLNKLDFRLIN
jgi:hypothetical protein